MKEPFFGQQYKKTGSGARKKGDPMDEETFNAVKHQLSTQGATGVTKTEIAEICFVSTGTVRLISKCKTFAEYRQLRSQKSNWHADAPKKAPSRQLKRKRGFLARILRR